MSDHTNSITWHEIKRDGIGDNELPDGDEEILIYCAYIDDTVLGSIDADGEQLVWLESASGQQLVSPAYWAKKPFPAWV